MRGDEHTLLAMRSSFAWLGSTILIACSAGPDSTAPPRHPATRTWPTNAPVAELSDAQQASMEALNTLQVNTQENRLYSTFANIPQPCYPPDTSFSLTRVQLQDALQLFVAKHYPALPVDQRVALVSKAVMAQDDYIVLLCRDGIPANGASPMTGTWVIPNLLGQRDVVLVW